LVAGDSEPDAFKVLNVNFNHGSTRNGLR